MANLTGVVQQLKAERDRAANEVQRLNAALAALSAISTNGAPTRSTARRGRLSAAWRALNCSGAEGAMGKAESGRRQDGAN